MFLPLRLEAVRLRAPAATLALLAATIALFAYESQLEPAALLRLVRAAGAVPWELSHGRDLVDAVHPPDLVPPPFTIATSWFLHGDLVHLLGNAWFLWLFGSALEGRLGAARFLLLYASSGMAAAAIQTAASPESTAPMIGASGAIAGVLGATARLLPRARARCLVLVLLFVTFVTLPASVLLVLWFLVQLAAAGGRAPGVAWFAHIGGFAVGYLVALALSPRGARLGYSAADELAGEPAAQPAQAGGGRAGAGSLGANPAVEAT